MSIKNKFLIRSYLQSRNIKKWIECEFHCQWNDHILLGDKCTYHQAKVETNLSYKTIITNHDPILGRFFTKNLCYARYYHNDCLFKNFLHIRGQRSFLKQVGPHILGIFKRYWWQFFTTVAQIFSDSYYEICHFISKNCCWYFSANLWKNWATLNSNIWTHLSLGWPNFGQMTRNEFQGWSTTINATPAPRMIETRPQCPSSHR